MNSTPKTTSLLVGGALLATAAAGAGAAYYIYKKRQQPVHYDPDSKPREWLLLEHVYKTAKLGDAQSVLDTIDQFAWGNKHFFMNIGDVKGKILDDALEECKPKTVLELGAYCGYSAIRIGRAVQKWGGKVYSIELNPAFAAISRQMVEAAGLADTVTIIQGILKIRVDMLRERYGLQNFDLVFLDHWKEAYLSDAKLILEHKLLHDGSYMVADNVIYPGCPEYLKFIRAHPNFTSTLHESNLEYSDSVKDGVEVSIYHA
mmetsp:Transcript_31897/g.79983  ORF Transcript_31897/g.79983 Transcript_31897/m.79983 type:complete len:260 (+) Transcript_31897:63-842(+)